MKRLFTFLFFTIIIPSLAWSQNESSETVLPGYPEKGDSEFSVQLGYNTSSLTSDDIDETETTSGLYVGGKASFYWSSRWSFTTGLYYDQKGSGVEGSGADFKLNYLTVPLNLNWHFGRNRRWNLNFGPSVALFLSGSEAASFIEDDINSVDIGLDLGIGHKIPVGSNYIQISLNGSGGFADIFKNNNNAAIRNARNNIAVGFIF